MDYPFYHMKTCRKAASTVRNTDNNQKSQTGPHISLDTRT